MQKDNLIELDDDAKLSPNLLPPGSSSANLHKGAYQSIDEQWIPYINQKNENCLTKPCWPGFFKLRKTVWGLFSLKLFTFLTIGELLFGLLVGGGLAGYVIYYCFIYDTSSFAALANAIYYSGRASSIAQIFVFSFACRNSIWLFLCGIPFDRALFWHKFFVLILVVNGFCHGWISGKFKWGKYGLTYYLTICSFVVISFWMLRRKLFELYYYLHILVIFWLIVVSYLHALYFSYVGYLLWGLDLIIRQCLTLYNLGETQKVDIK